MTSWMAGVTHVPHEHCAPDQFHAPSFAPHRPCGHTSLPSKSSATDDPIQGRGSLRNSELQGLLPPRW